jgi:hypothetical protein
MNGLGLPPEFGSSGKIPPIADRLQIVSTSFFTIIDYSAADGEAMLKLLLSFPTDAVYRDPGFADAIDWLHQPRNYPNIGSQLRRFTYSQRWVRDDPIVQIPPGVTIEHAASRTVGISETHARELSAALGIKSPSHVNLSAELKRQTSLSISVNQQQTTSQTITLTNDRKNYYRRFALWRVEHSITIHGLTMPYENSFQWVSCASMIFFASPTAESVTSSDVKIKP